MDCSGSSGSAARSATDDLGLGVRLFQPQCPVRDAAAIFQLGASFRPSECPIALASYVCVRFYAVTRLARGLGVPLFNAPLGIGVMSRRPVPPQHGTGNYVEVAAGPGAWRVGKCAGVNDRPIACRKAAVDTPLQSDPPTRCRSVSRHDRQGCRRRVCLATLCEVDLTLTSGGRVKSPLRPSSPSRRLVGDSRGGALMLDVLNRAERYRELAEECRRLAATSLSAQLRTRYSCMAQDYRKRAEWRTGLQRLAALSAIAENTMAN
jgi:hypothetical protein